MLNGTDLPGDDTHQIVFNTSVQNPAALCQSTCCADATCMAWTYAQAAPSDFGSCILGKPCCYLKSGSPAPHATPGLVSGTVQKTGGGLKSPPLGMRSAPPLGGWATGSMELR